MTIKKVSYTMAKAAARVGLISAVFLVLMVPSLHAAVLEEIVVTAQKREQNMQDVGISIVAISGDDLRDLGYTNANDIARFTPNFSMVNNGDIKGFPSIRGVSQNDFSEHQETPIAIYVDEIYQSFMAANTFTLVDIERAEVLRGPQGTLFGRNATGGLVQYVTRKPTESFESYLDFSAGDFDYFGLEAAISGPLTDKLLGRLSLRREKDDGWWENTVGPNSYQKDVTALRGQLLINASDNVDVLLSVGYGLNDKSRVGTYTHTPGGIGPDGLGVDIPGGTDFLGYRDPFPDLQKSEFNPIGFLDKEFMSYTGKVTWFLSNGVALTSLTSYQDFEMSWLEDCDAQPHDLCEYQMDQDANQFTQELRLEGETGAVKWQAGLYYVDIETAHRQRFEIPDITFFDFNAINTYEVLTTSYAAFGQIEYEFADSWTFIAGLRSGYDEKEMESVVVDGNNGGTWYDFSKATVGDLTVNDDAEWSGKLELDWHPGDNLLVYGSISRGYKGPGFNANIDGSLSIADTPFDSEVITAYETGFKTTIFDGTTRLNGGIFYYDYTDFQVFNFNGLSSVVSNSDAELYGGELEIISTPAEGWTVVLGMGYTDGTVFDVSALDGVRDRTPTTTPKNTANGMLRREWPALGGSIALQADFTYSDEYEANIANQQATHIDSYTVWNGLVGYTSGGGSWNVQFFAKNLADEDYEIYAFDLSGFYGVNIGTIAPPRQVGVRFRYNWN